MPIKMLACHDMDEFSSTDGTAWLKWDADSNHLIVSKAAVQLLHLAESDVASDQIGLAQIFDKRSISKLAIAFEDTLESREPQTIDLSRNSSDGTQLLRLHVCAAPSQHPGIILARIEDLGENSECQHQISASMNFARFVNLIGKERSFFETVPLGLVIVQDAFITQANAKASEILGCTVKGLLGEPVSRILSSKQSYDTYMKALWDEEIEDEQNSVDVEYEDDHGTVTWLRVSVTRITSTGTDGSCLCMLEDITDRKKLEQDVWNGLVQTLSAKEAIENASRAKGEFLAMVSHEIRTPLSAVIGMLRLTLRDTRLPEKAREHLDMAQTNAEFLLDLLNDILDFSKIEAGKLVLEDVGFSLRHLITDSVGILVERAEAKNISLHINIGESVPDTLMGDPARLKQILINLIGNGIKFTDKGSVSLTVDLTRSDGESNVIRFNVRDTGIGIVPEAQVKLFQKFAQADTSTTRRFGGTGLGLAICKQLVDLMQGEIGLTSKLNEGSCFSFEIPFKLGEVPANAQHTHLQQHSHQLQILCAEDFLPNQLIIQSLLEGMGHRVDFAANGRKALEALPKRNYDLVLMDGRMPEMDGAEAIRTIRTGGQGKFYIPNPNIRIIVLTANADDESRQSYFSCGADDFLVKPIDEMLLHQSLARAIEVRLAENASLLPLLKDGTKELEAIFGSKEYEPDAMLIRPSNSSNERNKDDGGDLKTRLQIAFRSVLEDRLTELEVAYQDRNFASMANIFHGLKGSAGYIWPGSTLQNSSALLEKAADQEDWQYIETEMPNLRKMLGDVMKGTYA